MHHAVAVAAVVVFNFDETTADFSFSLNYILRNQKGKHFLAAKYVTLKKMKEEFVYLLKG